tara:strand:+ start:177 stop:2561 length:2385 start_codon:yes stop_codon:yes gene_type:complete
MKKVLLFITVLFAVQSLKAQLAVSNTAPYNSPAYLVNNVLLGQNVTASNITFNGDPSQIGFFSNGLAGATNPLGIDSGIVISSGNVSDIPSGGNQPNTNFGNPGDPDLLTIAQSVRPGITSSDDAAALEFDFTPLGDTVEFRFSFASEEYLQWINSNFNDIFAFFLSGPGYAGPYAAPVAFPAGATNLALVPGTASPITISTIYVDPTETPTSMNGSYFINNPGENTFDFNGYTTVISIKFVVTCNALYHFKFAVSDCGDGTLDTGVLMEGSSFASSPPIGIQFSTVTGDSTIIEGCAPAKLNFIRSDTSADITLHYTIGGTAINGVDYATIADSVTYLAGIDTASVTIIPLIIAGLQGLRSITITVTSVNSCGNLITSVGTMYIDDLPNLITSSNDVTLPCPTANIPISVSANGAAEPYIYAWTDTQGNIIPQDTNIINVSGMQTDTFYVSTTDSCNLVTLNDTIIITVNGTLPEIQTTNDTILLCPNYTINIGASPTDGVSVYNYTWSHGLNLNVSPTQTTTYTVTAMDACGNTTIDSVVATVNYTPLTLDITNDTTFICPNITYALQVVATPSNGTAPYTYNWDASSSDTDNIIDISITGPQTVTTIATDFCGLDANQVMNVLFAPYTSMSLNTAPVDSTCANENVSIATILSGGYAPYSYLWSNGETQSPIFFSSETIGENNISVTVTDFCKLEESFDMIVNIINCKVDLVNIITPNGDAINDLLIFKGIVNFPKNHLTVLNRWGKTIFEKDNYQNDWDGDNAKQGTYFYVLELNNTAKIIHKGTFTLLK